MLFQRGLDLAQLNAKASDLHLIVAPPDVLNVAVRQVAGQVARAIHTRAGRRRERVGNESLRRHIRALQIAARQSVASNEQFAGHADGDGLQALIENVNLRVRHWLTDGDPGRARLNPFGQRPNGGLRRPVEIPQLVRPAGELLREFPAQRLTAA